MSYIYDCRTDEYYNQKYLNDDDINFINGYDYAVEQILNLIDNNSNVYPDLDDLLAENKALVNVNKIEIVHNAIEEWAESNRDEIIISMIDNMGDDDYAKIKELVDGQSKEKD